MAKARAFDWDGEWARGVAGDYVPTRYGGSAKQAYHDAARKVLKQVAGYLGLVKGDWEYRRCEGGPAVRGESILHTDRVYVAVGYSGNLGILVRACASRKDYTGERNHWLPWSMMDRPEELAIAIARIARRDPVQPVARPDIQPRTRRRVA